MIPQNWVNESKPEGYLVTFSLESEELYKNCGKFLWKDSFVLTVNGSHLKLRGFGQSTQHNLDLTSILFL